MPDKFTLELDASQMEQFQVCPLSWLYKYHESIRFNAALARPKAAPNKGTLIHRMLEVFYKELNEGKSRGAAARIAADRFINENWAKEFGLEAEAAFLKKRFFQYQAHWDDRDFSILKDLEGKPAVEIGFSRVLKETKDFIYIVTGRIDGITEINENYAWVDHKTQGRTMNLYAFCPQFLTYSWATKLNWGIVNYVRMHEEYDAKKTFQKQITQYPQYLIDQWERKMLKLFMQVHAGLISEDPLMYFYNLRNESSCAGPYKTNPCPYTTLCEMNINEKPLYNIVKASQYTKVERWAPWKIEQEEE